MTGTITSVGFATSFSLALAAGRLTVQCAIQSPWALGLQTELPNAATTADAAKCRVHRWENQHFGGTRINFRNKRIATLVRDSEHLNRVIVWNGWYKNNFFKNIQAGQQKLYTVARATHMSIPQLLQGASAKPTPSTEWQRRCKIAYK